MEENQNVTPQTEVSGVTDADAGHPQQADKSQRLQELGVPADKLNKRQSSPMSKKPTWEELMADPEYNARMQATVRARLKQVKEAQASPETGDKYREHFRQLQLQGQALKQVFPDFDLRQQLQDPMFAKLTHPSVGMSVEDAYHAIHRRSIQAGAVRQAAAEAARKISSAIAAGQQRPVEAGTSSLAPSVSSFSYRNASPDQRQALKKRILQAAARGEKIYPGR